MQTLVKFKFFLLIILFTMLSSTTDAILQYYCTAANEHYFNQLLGLIASIHVHNYSDLKEIAVFDLGLKADQVDTLKKIKKVKIYHIKEKNPNLLTWFPYGKLGCYSWKPVVIKESLERFPYVLWLDAGTTVLKPLDDLFQYIAESGYFICTIGDSIPPKYSVGWSTTTFLKKKFQLDKPENQWILAQESVMGGIIGASRLRSANFLHELYQLTKDIRYFMDDGTTPQGLGTGRHDQTVLSILAYLQQRKIFRQDFLRRKNPFYYQLRDKKFLFTLPGIAAMSAKRRVFIARDWTLPIGLPYCLPFNGNSVWSNQEMLTSGSLLLPSLKNIILEQPRIQSAAVENVTFSSC